MNYAWLKPNFNHATNNTKYLNSYDLLKIFENDGEINIFL